MKSRVHVFELDRRVSVALIASVVLQGVLLFVAGHWVGSRWLLPAAPAPAPSGAPSVSTARATAASPASTVRGRTGISRRPWQARDPRSRVRDLRSRVDPRRRSLRPLRPRRSGYLPRAERPAADALYGGGGQPGLELRFHRSQPVPSTPYGSLIYDAARRHEVNPRLVAAVVWAESDFDPQAVSAKGAQGLMQVMPATADRFGVGSPDLFDPEWNVDAGTRYLSWLADRFSGDLERILAAYNAGEAAVDEHGGVPPFPETRGFVRRVYSKLGLEGASE